MAVTVGKSAEKAVKAAVYAALNVTALTTALGASATPKYTVGVYGKVPQALTYPHVRVDAAGERPNSTYGRNGKDCRVYVQVFTQSEEQALDIQNTVLSLLNLAGGYNTLGATANAHITGAGFRLIHVNFDDVQVRDPLDDGNAVGIYQRTVMFTVTVEEA